MGPMFADSEFGETVDSQLTLGTASLLGIFFGLVMVCGIFFGFGYSIGRRSSSASMAAVAPVNKLVPSSTPQQTTEPQAPAALAPAAIAPASEPLIASLENAPAAPAMTLPRMAPAASVAPSSPNTAASKSTAPSMSGESHPPLMAAAVPVKSHIPKPSAFEPVVAAPSASSTTLQRIVAGPQFTSQTEPSPYFVWTPPFDVHRKNGGGRTVALVNTVHTRTTRPSLIPAVRTGSSHPALVLQIAALSRQDDAEVLASSLRKGGFTPSIKSGVEDALYHVEVGPFDRESAAVARQRLVAKGYNAILR